MSWVREVECMVKVNVMTGRQLKRLKVQGKERMKVRLGPGVELECKDCVEEGNLWREQE